MTKITDGEYSLINIEDIIIPSSREMMYIPIRGPWEPWVRQGLNSVVVHHCPAYNHGWDKYTTVSTPIYLTTPKGLHDPCCWCRQLPSEKIVTLWTLQNFDRKQSEDSL